MKKPYYKKGTWNAICDICGFEYKADEMRKNWKGLYVCKKDFETRHPQDFLKGRIEHTEVPWSRPMGTDNYIVFCTLITKQAIAGIGVAGCMVSGFVTNAEI